MKGAVALCLLVLVWRSGGVLVSTGPPQARPSFTPLYFACRSV